MEKISLQQELQANSYPGRGIVIGRSADGKRQSLLILLWEEARTAATVFLWKTEMASVHRHLIHRS